MRDEIEIAESLSALKQYIAKNEQNVHRHKANILIYADRKDHGPGTRVVSVTVNRKEGAVIIEDLDTIYGRCSNVFNTQDSSFFYKSNSLCIKSKGTLGGEIIIYIT